VPELASDRVHRRVFHLLLQPAPAVTDQRPPGCPLRVAQKPPNGPGGQQRPSEIRRRVTAADRQGTRQEAISSNDKRSPHRTGAARGIKGDPGGQAAAGVGQGGPLREQAPPSGCGRRPGGFHRGSWVVPPRRPASPEKKPPPMFWPVAQGQQLRVGVRRGFRQRRGTPVAAAIFR